MGKEPAFVPVSQIRSEAESAVADFASHNLKDPAGRPIAYISAGIAAWMYQESMTPLDLRYFLTYAHDVAAVGEERGRLHEIQFDMSWPGDHLRHHDSSGRIWIEAAGPIATMYFPDER